MKRLAVQLPILGVLTLVVVGGGMLAWHLRERTDEFYTDSAAMRLPADATTLRDVVWQPASPVAGAINTKQNEYEPRISADGTTMLFVRRLAEYDADIYTATRDGTGWSEPAPLPKVNSRADDLGPELSADGAVLHFYSNRAGGRGGYDLWISRRTADGWSEPANLGPAVNSAFNDYGPCLTTDGRTLFFASDRPRPVSTDATDGVGTAGTADISPTKAARLAGDYDLFSSTVDADGAVRPPVRVSVLNSPHNEGAPAVSPLGDFVYFASDRPGGQGGFDLWRSRRVQGELLPPEVLEASVNTAADELDPTSSSGGFSLHFSSNRSATGNGTGDYDLYHAMSREVFRQTETYRAEIDWRALLGLLGPFLAYLLIVIILIVAILRLQRRHKGLSLIARCVLTSLLIHALVLLCTTAWHVTSSLLGGRKDGGGTQVVLESSAVGREIAGQVRGGFTEVDAQPTLETFTPRQFTTPTQSAATTEATMTVAEATMSEPSALATETTVNEAQVAPATLHTTSEATPQPPSSAIAVRRPDLPQPVQSNEATAQASAAPPQSVRAQSSPEATLAGPASAAAPTIAVAAAPADVMRETGAQRISDSVDVAEATSPALTFSRSAEAVAQADTTKSTPLRVPVATAGPSGGTSSGAAEPAVQLTAGGASAPRQSSTPLKLDGGASPGTIAVDPTNAADAPSGSSLAAVTTAEPAGGAPPLATSDPSAMASPAPPVSTPLPTMALPGGAAVASRSPSSTDTLSGTPVANPTTPDRTRVALAEAGGRLQIDVTPPAAAAAPPTDSLANPPLPSIIDPAAFEAVAVAAPAIGDLPNLAHSNADGPPRLEEAAIGAEQVATLELEARVPGTRRAPLDDAALREGINRGDAPDAQTRPDRADPLVDAYSLVPIALPTFDVTLVHLDVEPAEPEYDTFAGATAVAIHLDVPTDELPPDMQYLQRAPEVREERLEAMGGNVETEAAVKAALTWLARHQSDSGAWSGKQFDARCGRCGGSANVESDTALTGLSLLAFLAADHSPTKDGEYRTVVKRALNWLLAQQRPDGSLIASESMYSHGIATIALAEAYGMSHDPHVGMAVKKATDFIFLARNKTFGGWRYKPGQIGDTSVLGWQVMALTSARRAGIEVSDEAFAVARDWLPKVADPCNLGLYSYQPAQNATPAMTAEAMFVQQLLGATPDDAHMKASADYIVKFLPSWRNNTTYFWYYATLALFQHGGPEWDRWNEALQSQLLRYQERDGERAGSWPPHDKWATSGGRVYQTALCALTLEVYYRYLPLYARDKVASN